MKYNEALDYIYARQMFGMKLGLDNIKSLMQQLNNSQDNFPSVHIAGTNGKGSVCALLSSILQEAGYKVGVYTSPHLVDFRERIKINGEKISKKHLAALVEKTKPLVKKHTYFEVVTALAFQYFAQQKVDIALVEVGLGGRLDATNVIKPELAVITNISLEHTEHLGNSIEKIAFEKAGIIKPGIDVVAYANNSGLKVITNACKERDCVLHVVKPKKVKTSLLGDFQQENAAVALKATDLLIDKGYKITQKHIDAGLLNAKWPGRMEFISNNVLFDCAHNPSGAQSLSKELRKLGKDTYIVLGIMKDKNIKEMCDALQGVAKEIIVTKPKIERSASPKKIAQHIQKNVCVIDDVSDAIEYAKLKAGGKGLVVVCGSIFTVGEAFSCIRPKPFDS